MAGVALGLAQWNSTWAEASAGCQPMGWFPSDIGLKDHSVFQYQGHTYLISVHLHPDKYEDRFAYARSEDWCVWEDLTPVLAERTPGAWDEFRIWAPFVYEEAGVYYMYYTGVTQEITQSIMLATSSDPADPAAWQPQGMIFQPAHAGAIWQDGAWADCRDPMVIRQGDVYYLYYTGLDEAGGIVGRASAPSPAGPWTDLGPVLTTPGSIPESPTIAEHGGLYYLFYTIPYVGERYVIGPSAAGPWGEPQLLGRGWAHEVWPGPDAQTYTSFLTSYTVTISPLTWDTFFEPPRPFVGAEAHHFLLPLVAR